MDFILGSGRLGKALISSLDPQQVKQINRPIYSNWWQDDAPSQITRFFEPWSGSKSTVYVAAGIINAKAPAEEHYRTNYLLAKNIIEGATKAGFHVVTFGTVMEKIIFKDTTNPYFSSKIKLGDFVSKFSTRSHLSLHIRMHTLYGGGLPARSMFLGELFHSILNKIPFNMSHGSQLREYHHVDDDVVAITQLVSAQSCGLVDLSHGSPIELRMLARHLFEHFDCLELLNIGTLPKPINENYDLLFTRSPLLNGLVFRDTIPAVINYLRTCHKYLGETIEHEYQ